MTNEQLAIVGREYMDKMKCGEPGCNRDHPITILCALHGRKLNAAYDKITGTLSLTCHVCQSPLLKLEIASKVLQ